MFVLRALTVFCIFFIIISCGVVASSAYLSWTAPGDDNTFGRATQYDIRYATSFITEENWNNATKVSGLPRPKPYGNTEKFTVTGLLPGTTYYFALRAADENWNWSTISNIAKKTTCADCTGYTGNTDGSSDGVVDLTDLTVLVNYLLGYRLTFFCLEQANVDASEDGTITITDLTYLVSYLSGEITNLPACP